MEVCTPEKAQRNTKALRTTIVRKRKGVVDNRPRQRVNKKLVGDSGIACPRGFEGGVYISSELRVHVFLRRIELR